jgi:hypothetical protein
VRDLEAITRRGLLCSASSALFAASGRLRVACILNAWFPNSHADVFVTRLLDGYRLDRRWHAPRLDVALFYVDRCKRYVAFGLLDTVP